MMRPWFSRTSRPGSLLDIVNTLEEESFNAPNQDDSFNVAKGLASVRIELRRYVEIGGVIREGAPCGWIRGMQRPCV